jgi:2-dehydro-3-deoxyphosphogalactonate aldolase
MTTWSDILRDLPLVAILRGVRPTEAAAIAEALYAAGWRCVETPLNSPDPLASIEAIAQAFAGRMLVGAGTVLSPGQAKDAAAAGAQFIVSPNVDAEVIGWTKSSGLIAMPGAFTATEAFSAIAAGAHAVKIFPAELTSPAGLKALKAVLPADIPLFPTGGIAAEHFASYLAAGAAGFGVGGTVYKPGSTPQEVHRRAREIVRAFKEART